MTLSDKTVQTYKSILKEELVAAMGCTEPIAIAYASAVLRHALGTPPTSVRIGLSGNIIKNVKSVIVPATGGMRGIAAAVAAGVIAGCPERKLEVLCALDETSPNHIATFMEQTPIEIYEVENQIPFEIDLTGQADSHTVRVHLVNRHTNITEDRKSVV